MPKRDELEEGECSSEESRLLDVEKAIHVELNRLRGRLCGLIESWGLDERRESACKQTLKAITYDSEKLLVDLTSDETSS
jgi:hypothetical protein